MTKETLFQLCDICYEILNEIRDHLNYLNISVYKAETINLINEQIKQLKILMESIPSEGVLEPFFDFEAEKARVVPIPGECSFSMRVQRFIGNVELELKNLSQSHELEGEYSFEKVRKYKDHMQSSCPVGSKRWKFFQSI